jgi:hypothetical protein
MKNGLKGVVSLGTFKESGFWNKSVSGNKTDVAGVIYSVKGDDNRPIKFGVNQKLPTDLSKLDDIKEKLCDVQGNILQTLSFNTKVYWNIDTD